MNTPILMYHALSKEKDKNSYTIEEKDFLNHMRHFHANGYESVLIDDFYPALLNSLKELPKKRVVITFDDGHESDFTMALPILKQFNFRATFFVTTDWIGKPGFMNAFQLKKLKEEGMSVQSHGKTHLFMDKMGIDEIYSELKQSIGILEDILGSKVSFVAFPGGRYNDRVIHCAKKLGVLALLSSEPFSPRQIESVYLIGRHVIKYSWGKTDIEKFVNNDLARQLTFQASYYLKYLMKKMLPDRLYSFLWKKYITR